FCRHCAKSGHLQGCILLAQGPVIYKGFWVSCQPAWSMGHTYSTSKTWSLGPGQSSMALSVKIASCFSVLESMKSQTPSTKLQTNLKFQSQMTKTQNRFGILKLGTRPQGGESKRSADNFGHCDLFDICDL
ncbi:MAG: hypothetical protein V3W52_11470, partial [Syntrophobacteria bacterium]